MMGGWVEGWADAKGTIKYSGMLTLESWSSTQRTLGMGCQSERPGIFDSRELSAELLTSLTN